MTENEALKILNNECEDISKVQIALKVAREALEEIQQYRAIGLTPELIEAMQGHNVALINDLGEYQAIGTAEEFKTLKEKSVAKKPIKINIPNTSWCRKQERYECPSCHKYLNFRELSYCCVCGQKFDWQ